MVADIDAEIAAHPNIVYKFSIGQSYEGRDHLGGQDQRQRRRRRERARGPVRRPAACARAPRRRGGTPSDPPLRRQLQGQDRARQASHRARQDARDLDRPDGQPGRRRVRHLERHGLPELAQATASRSRAAPRSASISIATGATSGAAAAVRRARPAASTVPRSQAVVRARSSRRCATSCSAALSMAGSRSARPSRGTPSTNRSCGPTAIPSADLPRTMTARGPVRLQRHRHEHGQP